MRLTLATVLTGLFVLGVGASASGIPILQDPTASAPEFIGSPATPDPVYAPDPPRHPFMAPNGASNIHDDAYMTDTYQRSGPLGRDIQVTSSMQTLAECGSVNFDTKGRIVTVCVAAAGSPRLVLMDPVTLDTLAQFSLPPRNVSANAFTDFSGGGYFYLDNQDRAVVPTASRHLFIVGETAGPGLSLEREYDLTGAVPDGDKIISTLPDWSGRIWFISTNGVVGAIDPASGRIQVHDTKEAIGNSFAVDETGGVYIVTDKAMYRFDADSSGAPQVTWREVYPNIGAKKPGQTEMGSGTTPTLMGPDLVAITDNDDPMNIVVYRRARSMEGGRVVCSQPVFPKGMGSTDNSLIGTARSLVVENNYGYTGPTSTLQGGVTVPGIERVDLDADGHGCHKVWENPAISPTVVPKLSLRNGLVYAYTKTADSADPWYLTAIDFRTGKTVFQRLSGLGLGFNNNYAPVTIGPDGAAYVGVLGGLVTLRDKTPPADVAPRAPRLGLSTGRRSRGRFAIRLSGADVELVRRVDFFLAGRKVRDRNPPWGFNLSHRPRRARTIRARVVLHDGRILNYSRRLNRRARAASSDVFLRIRYRSAPASTRRVAVLRCQGTNRTATGFLAHRSAARLCRLARSLGGFLAQSPDPHRYCTQIYGGPQTAYFTGHVGNHEIARRFYRRNGCEIEDWGRVSGLLPRVR